MAKLIKQIEAENGDLMDISFNYSRQTGEVDNFVVHVWDKDRSFGFDLTPLCDTKGLSFYFDKIIQDIISEQ